MTKAEFDESVLPPLDGLHFHTLCEQDSDALETTLRAFDERFGGFMKGMKWLNFGGGHHITREGYDIPRLERCIRAAQSEYGCEVYLEPGEAVVLNAGTLVAEVLDVVHNGIDVAVLDASAACHMPDVLEMPYRPPVCGLMSTEKKAPVASSTKDLARTLGKKELMGIAIGQIIGAGIMSMMGVAIAMTGRSANLAFMLSAVFTMCTFFPSIFITSCIRMRGGMYTQFAIFAGDKWAGYYSVVYFITNMSLAMYALSFAEYALALLPTGGNQKVIALIVGTLFFVLNYFGVDLMAKIQNLLVVVLVLSLSMFAVFGLPHVDLVNYFSNADGLFLTDGIGGFLTATAYLGFATGGATVILGVSAECKNPTKDIPFVIIVSTVSVAILYGLVATAAAGVLPVAEVANQPLTLVANKILPQPLYVLFIVGGAMFALATTLNSQIMSCTKPVMQSCEDGWFPQSLASLSKFKTPWKILVIYYVILVVPILLDLQISQISSIVQILGYINNLIFTITAMKLPKMFPEAWEKSQYKVPTPVFNTLMIITCIAILIQASFMIKSMTPQLIIFNVAVMAVGFIWAFYRTGSGKAKPTVSYEMA